MFHFLFFIFLLIIIIVFFGLSLIRWFLGAIFGKRPSQPESYTSQQQQGRNQHSQNNQSSSTSSQQKKIIDSDEGEYIEYEEIKD